MKKIIFILLMAVSFTTQAQSDSAKAKVDTTIQILLPLDTYNQLLYVISVNIDSKKVTQEVLRLFEKSAIIYDKPKELPKPEVAKKKN